MKFHVFLLSLFLSSILFAQKIDVSKSVLIIPDSLTKNANVVVRNYNKAITILSKKEMLVEHTMFITVLNKLGDENPFFIAGYDKHASISNIKIIVYNSFGKQIKKVKRKEIKDISSSDGFSLFNDDRLKYYKYIPNKYPYSIAISYTRKTSNTAFVPYWQPIHSFNTSIQKHTITINYSKELKLNYMELNFDKMLVDKMVEENKLIYSVANIKAIGRESYMPNLNEIVPNVSFSLNTFSLAGELGNANSWKEFGSWMDTKLLKGRNELPEKTKTEIHHLVKDIDEPMDRAKLVYKYMQDKTRYISVQIGIGGWKPMLVKDVDKMGYGDCKALSYYTQALMNEADVPSFYTIVYSGDKKNIKKDLVSVQGNHVILMLPSKKDTIWLECTSQKLPFGQTGNTDDRDVLIITPQGGKIVHTRKYKDAANHQKITGNYSIDTHGNLDGRIEIESSGKQYNQHYFLDSEKQDDLVTYYKEQFSNILDVAISDIELKNDKENIVFTETLVLKAPKYGVIIGDEIMIKLNAYNILDFIPKKNRNRKYPLKINTGFKDEDEITITIPKNYKFNFIPENVLIETKFGKYQIEIIKKSNTKLLYKRLFFIKKGIHPKTFYEEFRDFLKTIHKKDKLKIIMDKI